MGRAANQRTARGARSCGSVLDCGAPAALSKPARTEHLSRPHELAGDSPAKRRSTGVSNDIVVTQEARDLREGA